MTVFSKESRCRSKKIKNSKAAGFDQIPPVVGKTAKFVDIQL